MDKKIVYGLSQLQMVTSQAVINQIIDLMKPMTIPHKAYTLKILIDGFKDVFGIDVNTVEGSTNE